MFTWRIPDGVQAAPSQACDHAILPRQQDQLFSLSEKNMFEKCSDERRDSISVIQSVKNKIVILKTVEYRISQKPL